MVGKMKKYDVQNITEEMVQALMGEVVQDTGMCGCARCRADLLALSLNKLKPRYKVTGEGDTMQRFLSLIPQNKADLYRTMYEEAMLVKANPRHNENDLREMESGESEA